MPEKKSAVDYAEEDLDVHGVWDEAVARLAQHEDAKNLYVTTLAQIRMIKSKVQSLTMDITSDERGKFPDMKPTPFRDHVRTVVEDHPELSALRSDMAEAESARDQAKADLDHHALGLGAITARMNELAGLLTFYSAAKAAAVVSTT